MAGSGENGGKKSVAKMAGLSRQTGGPPPPRTAPPQFDDARNNYCPCRCLMLGDVSLVLDLLYDIPLSELTISVQSVAQCCDLKYPEIRRGR